MWVPTRSLGGNSFAVKINFYLLYTAAPMVGPWKWKTSSLINNSTKLLWEERISASYNFYIFHFISCWVFIIYHHKWRPQFYGTFLPFKIMNVANASFSLWRDDLALISASGTNYALLWRMGTMKAGGFAVKNYLFVEIKCLNTQKIFIFW